MVNVEGSLSADLIAQQNFGAARRGFDPDEVRAFLVKVAAEIVALHERQAALEEARREAEYRAAHPSFDEETLLGAVGEETAHILRSAHEAAGDIKNRAEENASRILKEAHEQAEAFRGHAETVLARRSEEAEKVAGRIMESARAEAERLVDQSRQQAKAIRAQSEAERNAMIEGAQATREKILSALSKKRNVAVAQVEQLRAGRDRLLLSYEVVRRTLEEATTELARAEAAARAAADAVRHRPLGLDEPDGLDDDNEPTNPTMPIIQKRLRPASGPAAPGEDRHQTPPPPPAGVSVPDGIPAPPAGGGPAGDGPIGGVAEGAPVGAGPGSATERGPESATGSAAAVPAGAEAVQPPSAAAQGGADPGDEPPVSASSNAPPGGSDPPVPAPPVSAPPVSASSGAPPGGSEASGDTPSGSAPSAPAPAGSPAPGQGTVGAVELATSALARSGSTVSGPGSPGDATSVGAGPSSGAPKSGGPAATMAAPGAGLGPAVGGPTAVGAPAGVVTSPTPDSAAAEEPSTDKVNSLFARIRADRERAVAHAHDVLADPRPVPDGDETLLQQRDAVVDPIEANLTRRLKRALQDDQNDLLDRLRGLRSSQKAATVVIPPRDAHAARFRDVAQPFLMEAMTAGVAFTVSLLPGVKPSEQLGGLEQSADQLVSAIVEPLRRRLESVLDAGDGDDPVVLAEAVGGAYREWKTKRVELVAADHVATAFIAGAYAATPPGTTLRWLVQDTDGPCPDCDDNVLAGEQPKGEPFPTGQRHPPAHPGCRCLLVPQPG